MASCTLCTWEATSALFAGAFLNGGPASAVYGFIIATLGTLAIAASMAEMAAMCEALPGVRSRSADQNIALLLQALNTTGVRNMHPGDGAPSWHTSKAGSRSRAGSQLLRQYAF